MVDRKKLSGATRMWINAKVTTQLIARIGQNLAIDGILKFSKTPITTQPPT